MQNDCHAGGIEERQMIDSNDEVSSALSALKPVVALETTIFSNLGLPSPANEQALDRCMSAIRALGAVPALLRLLMDVYGPAFRRNCISVFSHVE